MGMWLVTTRGLLKGPPPGNGNSHHVTAPVFWAASLVTHPLLRAACPQDPHLCSPAASVLSTRCPTGYVTLGKCPTLSGPQSPSRQNGDSNCLL